MPASVSAFSADSLAPGSGAPGSVILDILSSMFVMVIPILQSMSPRMSMSLMMRSDLVCMWTRLLLDARTSRHIWVSLNFRSAYWYGSVTVPMPMTPSTAGSSLARRSGMFLFTLTTLHLDGSEWVTPGP